jgi:hypothetical protein
MATDAERAIVSVQNAAPLDCDQRCSGRRFDSLLPFLQKFRSVRKLPPLRKPKYLF